MVPVDLEEEGGGAPERGLDDYLKQFSRKEQESAFGKAAFRAYDRGDITAGQLLTQRTHELSPEHFAELKDAWEGPLP